MLFGLIINNNYKVEALFPQVSYMYQVEMDLCHAFEYLILALCKYQKWKEKVRISKYQKFGDLILKTMAFVKFLKTENSTKNIWEFYIGWALIPIQPRYHANAHTTPFKILESVSFQKPHYCHSFQW